MRFFGLDITRAKEAPAAMPRASGDGGLIIRTAADLDEALRSGSQTASGISVTPESSLRTAAVFGCVRLISGATANLPLDIKRRVDDRTRIDATDTAIWNVLRRRPNRWQKPAQFKRMMQAHVLLRGNAYALKTWSARGEVTELTPLDPSRVVPRQRDDLTMEYLYTRKDGRQILFSQRDILHLFGLSLDGITGVTPIAYARETIGMSQQMARHGAKTFANGANISGALLADRPLTAEMVDRLKANLEEFSSGGARDGKSIILENGLKYERIGMTAEDTQWIEGMNFSRVDVCMFFGVPPHLLGHTVGNTQLGSSIEQQGQGFVTYAMEDYLTMWEEAITSDCIDGARQPDLYARFNRSALVRGDIKARWEAHVKALQWGVRSPNEVRALEDENPRADGDIYYPPPNMTAPTEGTTNEPPQSA